MCALSRAHFHRLNAHLHTTPLVFDAQDYGSLYDVLMMESEDVSDEIHPSLAVAT